MPNGNASPSRAAVKRQRQAEAITWSTVSASIGSSQRTSSAARRAATAPVSICVSSRASRPTLTAIRSMVAVRRFIVSLQANEPMTLKRA